MLFSLFNLILNVELTQYCCLEASLCEAFFVKMDLHLEPFLSLATTAAELEPVVWPKAQALMYCLVGPPMR